MIVFRITTHSHMPGVGLSCDGAWCNYRYPSDEAAVKAIEGMSRPGTYKIIRERFTRSLYVVPAFNAA